jgi:hypothetical protein
MPHHTIEKGELATSELPHANDDVTDFPTILLTHVPLYRAPGTPCGPLREHWPPTAPPAGQPPLEHDDRNAIAVRGGYQYQNVLNREITADIAEKIGDIRYAFSGDDHDYCELVHKAYASAGGGIREITVKSISWAMGVRLPGVMLVSLWNPVDEHGRPKNGDASKTIQTKLCLLPDQIGTFLRYGMLFGFTFILLLFRAALVTLGVISTPVEMMESPLLPTTNTSAENEKSQQQQYQDHAHEPNSSNSSAASERGNLSVRTARTRSISPGVGGYGLPSAQPSKYSFPLVQHAGYDPAKDVDDSKGKVKVYGGSVNTKPRKKRKGIRLFWYELRSSLRTIILCGVVWYAWLVWRG